MIRQIIKQELKERKWAITRLSKETNVRYETLTEFLNGNKGLSIQILEKVFDKLDLTIKNLDNGH